MPIDTPPAPHRGPEAPAHESLPDSNGGVARIGWERQVRPRSDPPARRGVASQTDVGAPPNRYQLKIARSYPHLLEVAAGRSIGQHIIESKV
jgi:hypothetical protein